MGCHVETASNAPVWSIDWAKNFAKKLGEGELEPDQIQVIRTIRLLAEDHQYVPWAIFTAITTGIKLIEVAEMFKGGYYRACLLAGCSPAFIKESFTK